MNNAILSGYVGQDPELRTTQNGIKVATYSLGVYRPNPKEKDKPLTDWFNVVAWGETAESVIKHVKKGSYILVNGKFQTRSYDNKEGKKIVVTEFMQNDLWLAPPKGEEAKTTTDEDDNLPF